MSNIFFHIDVNSAFLSWSAVDKLKNGYSTDLREIPSIIGGDVEKRHGVVLAKSVPAKAFLVSTGEPISDALKKCPHLFIEPPNHELYEEYSHKLLEFLSSICPVIEQASIDECYMDYTPITSDYNSYLEAADSIRKAVQERFGFTVNIGISDKKVLAKMASDFKKPNYTHTLFQHEIQKKLWPLPVPFLFMCGKSSVESLHRLEIKTIGDLALADIDILTSHLKSHGRLLWEYANGIDNSPIVSVPSILKGIGNSTTVKADVAKKEDAYEVLLYLAETVSRRLRDSGQAAGMVSTEIKYNTFQRVSHQTTLDTPTQSTKAIYRNACRLFDELWDHVTPIRLFGIRTSKLISEQEPIQLTLFDDMQQETIKTAQKNLQLDQTLDQIKKRFGEDAVVRGSLLKKKDVYKKH